MSLPDAKEGVTLEPCSASGLFCILKMNMSIVFNKLAHLEPAHSIQFNRIMIIIVITLFVFDRI